MAKRREQEKEVELFFANLDLTVSQVPDAWKACQVDRSTVAEVWGGEGSHHSRLGRKV